MPRDPQTTTALLAGELSTQNFSDKHPEVAEQWVKKIWNASLLQAHAECVCDECAHAIERLRHV